MGEFPSTSEEDEQLHAFFLKLRQTKQARESNALSSDATRFDICDACLETAKRVAGVIADHQSKRLPDNAVSEELCEALPDRVHTLCHMILARYAAEMQASAVRGDVAPHTCARLDLCHGEGGGHYDENFAAVRLRELAGKLQAMRARILDSANGADVATGEHDLQSRFHALQEQHVALRERANKIAGTNPHMEGAAIYQSAEDLIKQKLAMLGQIPPANATPDELETLLDRAAANRDILWETFLREKGGNARP